MATKLYLRPSEASTIAGAFLGTDPAFWDGASISGGYTDGGSIGLLPTPGTGATTGSKTSVAGPTAGICSGAWVSAPLAAGFTLSGTVTFSIWAQEAVSGDNAGMLCRLYKMAADGTLTAIVTDSAQGTELSVGSLSERVWTASPTSTAFAKGDRIVLFTGYDDAGGNMGAGSTLTIAYDGADATTGDSYVQLTENVTFVTSTPAGTKLYLLSGASSVDDGADEREMWTAAGSSTDTAVRNTAAGPTARLQVTKTAGGSVLSWYSKRLAAFTLSGPIRVRLRMSASDSLTRARPYAELARVEADGTSPVVWAYGGVPYLGAGNNAITDTNEEFVGDLQGDSLGFAGHRLRLRVYIDENYWTDQNVMAAGKTVTLTFAGTTDTVQSWIQLSETVTEHADPSPVAGPYRIPIAQVY